MLPTLHTFHKPFVQDFFDHFDKVFADVSVNGHSTFPKYNIIRNSDEEITVELALAGYPKDSINVSVVNNKLTVEGEAVEDSGRDYLQKEIAFRKFKKQWSLPRNIEVTSANMENGILSIKCQLLIPEEEKPKLIDIT